MNVKLQINILFVKDQVHMLIFYQISLPSSPQDQINYFCQKYF